MVKEEYVAKGAAISADGRYRYRLWREWRLHPKPAHWETWEDGGRPMLDGAGHQLGAPKSCVFIMLNPSTADGDQDDPTIRRCVGFAKAWGYDRLDVLNLFAYRATEPSELLALDHMDDPVGPGNLSAFRGMLDNDGIFGTPVGTIICAWGNHGTHLGQDETVLGWLEDRERFALRVSKDGHPGHPLYLPAAARLVPFYGAPRHRKAL